MVYSKLRPDYIIYEPEEIIDITKPISYRSLDLTEYTEDQDQIAIIREFDLPSEFDRLDEEISEFDMAPLTYYEMQSGEAGDVSHTITIPFVSSRTIDSLSVVIKFQYGRRGDGTNWRGLVDIDIKSPTGTEVRMHDGDPTDHDEHVWEHYNAPNQYQWNYTPSDHSVFQGEEINGDWEITFSFLAPLGFDRRLYEAKIIIVPKYTGLTVDEQKTIRILPNNGTSGSSMYTVNTADKTITFSQDPDDYIWQDVIHHSRGEDVQLPVASVNDTIILARKSPTTIRNIVWEPEDAMHSSTMNASLKHLIHLIQEIKFQYKFIKYFNPYVGIAEGLAKFADNSIILDEVFFPAVLRLEAGDHGPFQPIYPLQAGEDPHPTDFRLCDPIEDLPIGGGLEGYKHVCIPITTSFPDLPNKPCLQLQQATYAQDEGMTLNIPYNFLYDGSHAELYIDWKSDNVKNLAIYLYTRSDWCGGTSFTKLYLKKEDDPNPKDGTYTNFNARFGDCEDCDPILHNGVVQPADSIDEWLRIRFADCGAVNTPEGPHFATNIVIKTDGEPDSWDNNGGRASGFLDFTFHGDETRPHMEVGNTLTISQNTNYRSEQYSDGDVGGIDFQYVAIPFGDTPVNDIPAHRFEFALGDPDLGTDHEQRLANQESLRSAIDDSDVHPQYAFKALHQDAGALLELRQKFPGISGNTTISLTGVGWEVNQHFEGGIDCGGYNRVGNITTQSEITRCDLYSIGGVPTDLPYDYTADELGDARLEGFGDVKDIIPSRDGVLLEWREDLDLWLASDAFSMEDKEEHAVVRKIGQPGDSDLIFTGYKINYLENVFAKRCTQGCD